MHRIAVILVMSFGIGIFAGCKGPMDKTGRTERKGQGLNRTQKMIEQCKGKIEQNALERVKKDGFGSESLPVESLKLWGVSSTPSLVEDNKLILQQYMAVYSLKKENKTDEGFAVFFTSAQSCKIAGYGASSLKADTVDADLEKLCGYTKKINEQLKCDEKCQSGRKILSMKSYELEGVTVKSVWTSKDKDIVDFYVLDLADKDGKAHHVVFDTSPTECKIIKFKTMDLQAPGTTPSAGATSDTPAVVPPKPKALNNLSDSETTEPVDEGA